MEEAQLNEVNERERIARELADENRLSSSFVELLNEHQLFDSFFVDDADGKLLQSTGEEAVNLAKEYVLFLVSHLLSSIRNTNFLSQFPHRSVCSDATDLPARPGEARGPFERNHNVRGVRKRSETQSPKDRSGVSTLELLINARSS